MQRLRNKIQEMDSEMKRMSIHSTNLIVNVPGKEFHFRNQRIDSLNDVTEFIKNEGLLAQFITDDTTLLRDNKQALVQQHLDAAQESSTLNITLSSPDV